MPLIHAHSAEVTDMTFSPHSDHLLATSSDDTTVKLWEIPQNNSANISQVLIISIFLNFHFITILKNTQTRVVSKFIGMYVFM